ncbi:MAG TPA: Hsp20/alpha crystallin family protein, partial [Mycobacterium sp.]|nr:Hsp20/alpha crystallin family protein [Mycobacterium sp.]
MMATLPAQRQPRTLMPDLAELFTGSPLFAGLRPLFDRNFLRLEDETKQNRYELRAEIPGIDPAKDVDITVRDGILTIKAVRSQKA